ncbi:hypothetical protein [Mucilaginibacter ginkgonis]|uniref:Uncharacterized protein n=1 Tax=Mucilaginibacter ginkgonis TaxID=2682091 RepID=A0A6I4HV21_9SPHI|nr:hypothetical protein [Mucilaginibacter ginkgonis]QQL50037.1 hypothetical protein GO620_000875 [Mucilaginibacter ginkgonis]
MISEEELQQNEVLTVETRYLETYIEGRDHESGDDFIMTGIGFGNEDDINLQNTSKADIDFIANAKQDIPRLIQEIRRLKSD